MSAKTVTLLLLSFLSSSCHAWKRPYFSPTKPHPLLDDAPPSHAQNGPTVITTPTSAICTMHYFTQPLDHFAWAPDLGNYQMRYYICGEEYWDKKETSPIFFYCGNEGDVTLYVNHSGLMWENAPKYNALMIFAEHRYYGKSVPEHGTHLKYLTHEQAMADYAELLYELKKQWGVPEAPVVAFGGSYGGMLAAWMRLKYPASIHMSVAASAPIIGFEEMGWDSSTYWDVVTFDASDKAGSSPACVDNVRASWPHMFRLAKDKDQGLKKLTQIFNLCDPIKTDSDLVRLYAFLFNAWDTLAMSNYPYPSSYLTNGEIDLPAFPVREACRHMADPTLSSDPDRLLSAMCASAGVFNNATGRVKCYNLPDENNDGIWDYQWCTELLPQETYFTMDGEGDMFFDRPYNHSYIIDHCKKKYGVQPRFETVRVAYGTLKDIQRYGSNIVFTNGNYDPWSSAGVLESLSPSMPSMIIDQGAHHLDLMFSHPKDPQSVRDVRAKTMEYIDKWLTEYVESMKFGPKSNEPPHGMTGKRMRQNKLVNQNQ